MPKIRGRKPKPATTAVGRAVQGARKNAGLSQSALAAMASITQATLSRIESGGQMPDMLTGHRLAAALGTTLDALFSGVLPRPKKNKSRDV